MRLLRVVLVLICPLFLQKAVAAPVAVTSASQGLIFAPGREVAFTYAGSSQADWKVLSFFGKTVAEGQASSARPRISVVLNRTGWFRLELRSGTDTATRWFAVLAPMVKPPAPARYGVMTHFAQGWDPDVLEAVSRAGIGYVRDELYWAEVEKARGRYDLSSSYLRYLNALKRSNLKLQLILSFANPLYDGGQTPYTDEGIAAFAKYSAWVTRETSPVLNGVEVWNEYNGSFCQGPCALNRPATYSRLLAETYDALKAARFPYPVAGGAAVLAPAPWFEALAQQGAFSKLDRIAVHPYFGVDQVKFDFDAIRAAAGRPIPFWASEFTYRDGSDQSDRLAAPYLVKMAATLLANGADRVTWYLLRDYAEFKGMGLLTDVDSPYGRYAPRPSYVAYANFIRFVRDLKPAEAVPLGFFDRAYRFAGKDAVVTVAWSEKPGQKVRAAAVKGATVFDLMGNTVVDIPAGASADLPLSADPVFIVGNTMLETIGPVPPVASAFMDFSGEQGRGGWTYLGYVCGQGETFETCAGHYRPDAAKPLSWTRGNWQWGWKVKEFPFLEINRGGGHPWISEGRLVWAVRRYTVDKSGAYMLTLKANRPSDGKAPVTVAVFQNGSALAKTAVKPGSDAVQEVQLTLAKGDRLDFVTSLTSGPGADFAATFLGATIERVGE